jgi:hypothetical protein
VIRRAERPGLAVAGFVEADFFELDVVGRELGHAARRKERLHGVADVGVDGLGAGPVAGVDGVAQGQRRLRPHAGLGGPEGDVVFRLDARHRIGPGNVRQEADPALRHADQGTDHRVRAVFGADHGRRAARHLRPERRRKVETERARVVVGHDRELREGLGHVGIELHRHVQRARLPHGQAQHGAVGAQVLDEAVAAHDLVRAQRRGAHEQRHALAHGFDHAGGGLFPLGVGQRGALAGGAHGHHAVDAALHERFGEAGQLVQVHRVGRIPALGAGLRRRRGDGVQALDVIDAQHSSVLL